MERLKILDGLRVLAITVVMIFHYLYLFNDKYYHLAYIEKEFFEYGYLGVQLFFIISGFVITLSLTKSVSFLSFLQKRWIRLFPAMLLCSILTFVLISLFDSDNLFPASKSIINLLVSNTFIPPSIINLIIKINSSYIDAPYWSLWVEIQFYIFIGVIYFINKKHFIRNFIIISISLSSLFYLSHQNDFFPEKINWFLKVVLEIFNFSEHALWFVLGVLVYKLYFIKKNIITLITILSVIFMQIAFLNFELYIILFCILSFFIFYCFLYNQKILFFLTIPLIQKIGIASYSIYLLHQNLGVLFIYKFYILFGKANFVLPILLIFLFFIFGFFIYKYFEKPFENLLKKKLFK